MAEYKAIVVDLDGTLCNSTHREELARSKQWDEFHLQSSQDKANEDVLWLVHNAPNVDIICLTGCNEKYRALREEWLVAHLVYPDALLMRPENNYENDHILKLRLLEEHLGGKKKVLSAVLFVLEDREKMVEAWRNYGVPCWQVRTGGY